MTLVKFLYSGDPDVIRNTRTCKWFRYTHLQGLFGLLPSLSPCVTPHALGRPCRGQNAASAATQVEVLNSQLISCLDSSLGRVAACGAGVRRFAPRP
jgi:hypothetical protein